MLAASIFPNSINIKEKSLWPCVSYSLTRFGCSSIFFLKKAADLNDYENFREQY